MIVVSLKKLPTTPRVPHTRGKDSFAILRPSNPKPLIIVSPKVILINHPVIQPQQNPKSGETLIKE